MASRISLWQRSWNVSSRQVACRPSYRMVHRYSGSNALLLSRRLVRPVIHCQNAALSTTNTNNTSTSPESPSASPYAASINHGLSTFPIECGISLAVLEGASFALTYATLSALSVHFTSTFVLAYVISVPIRKSLLPKLTLSMPLAYLITTVVPFTSQVHITQLTRSPQYLIIKRRIASMFVTNKTNDTSPTAVTGSPDPLISSFDSTSSSSSWQSYAARAADRYGLALFIAYRLSGALIVLTVYQLLEHGVTAAGIKEYVTAFGLRTDMAQRSVYGQVAGAVVVATILFPVTVLLAPVLGRLLYVTRNKILHTIYKSKQ